MVNTQNKALFSLLFTLAILSFSYIQAEDIKVVSEIDPGEAFENEPIKGTLSITHPQHHTIDTGHVLVGKDKLSVELVKEIQISPNNPLMLSIYRFQLPPQPPGLYALPSVTVRIGGKNYHSTMSSYTVEPQRKSRSAPTPTSSPPEPNRQRDPTPFPIDAANDNTSPTLRLEAEIQGSDSLYPGQRTTVVYRYFFSGDIALTTETLPLLEAQGFLKIGEKDIQDSVQGKLSIRTISQQVEAIEPGTYKLGPSLIEGYAYKEDVPGHPTYTSDKLSAGAPPVTITVLPFPKNDQPASFNGAVGHYTFDAKLASSATVREGDEMTLSLKISGTGNLKNVKAPDLCCQPGFSGVFRLSDLPPAEEIEDNTKMITVKLRPLNALMKAIPKIEFSFFDPDNKQYEIVRSQPIPISVKADSRSKNTATSVVPEPTHTPPASPLSLPSPSPKPIEIETIVPLSTSDLYNKYLGSWWALAIIPFGIALLIYQKHLQEYLEWQRTQLPVLTSKLLFEQAFEEKNQGKCDFEALEKSLRLALVEASLIPSIDAELPNEGLGKEVKIFWSTLDEKRFGRKSHYSVEEIYQLSKDLMSKISRYQQDHGRKI